jgi:GntR family transcriptional regulator
MEELINRENLQKLYLQLCEIIKRKIESKEWGVGSQIPTEDELCKMYDVSRATVRAAVLELVRQGYLYRLQGKGTFVKQLTTDELIMLTSFRELMLEPGVEFSTEVLVQTTMMPIGNIGNLLSISPDKHIIYIKRITVVEGKPVIIQEVHVPLHLCPQLLNENVAVNSLFSLFKKYKIDITRIRNYFGITSVGFDEAHVFGSAEGTSILLLNQLFFSGETPVMYIRSVKRQDSFGFAIEFKKSSMDERRFYVKR